MTSQRASSRRVDRPAMEMAIGSFLRAAGIAWRRGPLEKTPKRVADAWANELLAGYGKTAAEALAERFPASPYGDKLVMASGLHFRSTCPHHLLPFSGTIHLAYVPRSEVVGFGALSRLVETFAARLILQEDLASELAHALSTELHCKGSACLIEAEQACLRLRGERQHRAVTRSEAFEGVLRQKAWRAQVWERARAAST